MRITHQMLSRNFNKRMSTNLSNLSKSNEKMSSQRAYSKAHENVTDAGKALRMRKLINHNQSYLTTIRDVEGRVAAAEDSVRTVTALMGKATDRVVASLNGTYSPDDRKKMAQELEAAQGEVLQLMNVRFGEKYVFAASGNADGKAPFQVGDGYFRYNGTVVDDMVNVEGNPHKVVTAAKPGPPPIPEVTEPIKYNKENYVDIGFGFVLDADGNVDPNSAFKDTYSGIETFGYGKDANGTPKNAYSLLGSIVSNLRSNNVDTLETDLSAISESMEFMLTSIAELGGRSVTLQDTAAILENEYINLAESQGRLEGVDIAKESIFNKDFEMSWMITLQLGSKILPQSIFEFMR